LQTVQNATQLVSAPYAVPVGIYEVRITASYWSSYFQLSDKTVIVNTTVNVTWSELVAGIEGSQSIINASANETVRLSAYNLTYDLSIPSTGDKSGMILEWRCKRASEMWPSQLSTQSYLPHNGTSSGCFGDVGPGILGFAAGLWELTFNTGYLEPLVYYNIEFVVTKGSRSGSEIASLFIREPLAPVLAIRSVTYH